MHQSVVIDLEHTKAPGGLSERLSTACSSALREREGVRTVQGVKATCGICTDKVPHKLLGTNSTPSLSLQLLRQ